VYGFSFPVGGKMPGALIARGTEVGSAVETTTSFLPKMDTIVAEAVHGVGSGESSKEKRKKRRKKRRKLNSPDVGNGRDCDEPLDRVCC